MIAHPGKPTERPSVPSPTPPPGYEKERQEATLLTVDEVARACRVSDKTVLRWMRAGQLAYVLVGPTHRLRVRQAELERIIRPSGASDETSVKR